MSTHRRRFLRSVCLFNLCACGTASVVAAETEAASQRPSQPAPDPMPHKWIAALLPQIENRISRSDAKAILKNCSTAHYEHLGMDNVIAPFKGKLDEFLAHLTKSWGWKIEYDRGAQVIAIDEAKSQCVCPLVRKGFTDGLALLCDCSEGFAERMFSAVVGHPVQARVTASILRGASSCRYEIRLNN
jgi:hypothetical protein